MIKIRGYSSTEIRSIVSINRKDDVACGCRSRLNTSPSPAVPAKIPGSSYLQASPARAAAENRLLSSTTKNKDDRRAMASFLFLSFLAVFALAQYPPPQVNLTTIKSPVDGNITITYKTPTSGTCTTAFDSQLQYTGWVHIPGDYPTNTFFWFIAARQQTSQLTVWLNGGPGTSSMFGLFNENGPCEVIEIAEGKLGTIPRDWGWDRGSNMLYIDQVRGNFVVQFSQESTYHRSLRHAYFLQLMKFCINTLARYVASDKQWHG